MTINIPKAFDSKFRFIVVAAQRAKQLQNGAPPKIDSKGQKPAYIATKEVELELVRYEILEEEGEEVEGDEEQE